MHCEGCVGKSRTEQPERGDIDTVAERPATSGPHKDDRMQALAPLLLCVFAAAHRKRCEQTIPTTTSAPSRSYQPLRRL